MPHVNSGSEDGLRMYISIIKSMSLIVGLMNECILRQNDHPMHFSIDDFFPWSSNLIWTWTFVNRQMSNMCIIEICITRLIFMIIREVFLFETFVSKIIVCYRNPYTIQNMNDHAWKIDKDSDLRNTNDISDILGGKSHFIDFYLQNLCHTYYNMRTWVPEGRITGIFQRVHCTVLMRCNYSYMFCIPIYAFVDNTFIFPRAQWNVSINYVNNFGTGSFDSLLWQTYSEYLTDHDIF